MIDRNWLFDRPIVGEQITSAMLVFSDGTTIQVGPLPADTKKGVKVKFDAKNVKRVMLSVNGSAP